MNQSDSILLKLLLQQIKQALLLTSARSTALKANTPDYTLFAQKLTRWQTSLQGMSKKISSNKALQQLRSENIHSLPTNVRYSEKQSIDSNLNTIRQLEQQMGEIEKLLEALLFSLLVPSESEALFNAVSQLKSLHDWNNKLTKLTALSNASGNIDAILLTQEAATIQRTHQARNTRSSSAFPVQSMLLVVVTLLVIINRTMKK
jgi:hypothetical protein